MPAYVSQYNSFEYHRPSSIDEPTLGQALYSEQTPFGGNIDCELFQAGCYVPIEAMSQVQTSADPWGSNYALNGQDNQCATYTYTAYSGPLVTHRVPSTQHDHSRLTSQALSSSPMTSDSNCTYDTNLISWETASLYNSRSPGPINGHHESCYPSTSGMKATSRTVITQHMAGLPHHPAHHPIPPEQQSSYSELSVNLQFMDYLAQWKPDKTDASRSKPQLSSLAVPSTVTEPEGRKQSDKSISSSDKFMAASMPTPPDSPTGWLPTQVTFVDSPSPKTPKRESPTPTDDTTQGRTANKIAKGPKKSNPSCQFCKERKIACGRPPEGSDDPTCNQCKFRSFTCVYPKERIPRKPRSRK